MSPSMLYGIEAWCLKEYGIGVLKRTESAMCSVSLSDRRRNEERLLGLNESLECIARANGVQWYGHVLRREEEHVLKKALDFRVEGLRKRGPPKKDEGLRLSRRWLKKEGSSKKYVDETGRGGE